MDSCPEKNLDAFVAELLAKRDRLARELPDMDAEELFAILHSLMRPVGTGRRFFLRKQPDGSYVI